MDVKYIITVSKKDGRNPKVYLASDYKFYEHELLKVEILQFMALADNSKPDENWKLHQIPTSLYYIEIVEA